MEKESVVGETLGGEPGPTRTVSEVGLFRKASIKSCCSDHGIWPAEMPRRTDASPEESKASGSVRELTVAPKPAVVPVGSADSCSSNTLIELDRIGADTAGNESLDDDGGRPTLVWSDSNFIEGSKVLA